MSRPARPDHLVKQGPATRCVIKGVPLGWVNCTCAAGAHGVSRTSLDKYSPSACDVREGTRDWVAGTTISQVAQSVKRQWHIDIDVRTGPDYATPAWVANQLAKGRGVLLQGNTSVLVGTKFQTTGGPVNHAVWVNEVRGGSDGDPEEALVYDSAADGRRASWGKAAEGPQWWPWSLVLRFAAALRPAGDWSPRKLGGGKMYVGVFPDTEPHAHLHFGAARTTPFPDLCKAFHPKGKRRHVFVRVSPGTGTTPGPRAEAKDGSFVTFKVGETFTAYQVAHGAKIRGSDVWYGDHDGKWWIHESRLTHEGGDK